jgi:ADP-ribosylglycohydrolase
LRWYIKRHMDFDEYYDRVYGAWLGRVAGSHFGAPLEFRPFSYIQRKYCAGGRKEITGYVKPVDPNQVNDDEIYEIVGLVALETQDIDITSGDIARAWAERLYKMQFTAEKVALRNIRRGIMPPDCASEANGNIWYDAIGAQMKADIWGLIAPNCPEIAARYAEMDGRVAHQNVGVDGEIFIAGMISNGFHESDMRELIHKSLALLPSESPYRQFIEKTESIHQKHKDWRPAREEMLLEWHKIRKALRKTSSFKRRVVFLNQFVGGLHVLPNAGIITLSLLYGADDPKDPFGRPVCLGGMMALDADCNCGNIGAIMGTILGANKIPPAWRDPLKDTFHTYVKGYGQWRISELAQRICDVGRRVLAAQCPEKQLL